MCEEQPQCRNGHSTCACITTCLYGIDIIIIIIFSLLPSTVMCHVRLNIPMIPAVVRDFPNDRFIKCLKNDRETVSADIWTERVSTVVLLANTRSLTSVFTSKHNKIKSHVQFQ